jgi:hypothetical protein
LIQKANRTNLSLTTIVGSQLLTFWGASSCVVGNDLQCCRFAAEEHKLAYQPFSHIPEFQQNVSWVVLQPKGAGGL